MSTNKNQTQYESMVKSMGSRFGWLVSMAQLAPVGGSRNYNIWRRNACFSIQKKHCFIKKKLPSHDSPLAENIPLSWYPSRHSQWYQPGRLTQVARLSHSTNPSEHSSMSKVTRWRHAWGNPGNVRKKKQCHSRWALLYLKDVNLCHEKRCTKYLIWSVMAFKARKTLDLI